MKNPCLLLISIIFFQACAHSQVPGPRDYQRLKEDALSSISINDTLVMSLEEAMAHYGLTGLSVAVIDDYKVVWESQAGFKDQISREPLNSETAFSTASIAKPITATLFAVLEEQGKIDLDRPVANYLKRWRLPETDTVAWKPPTLKQLLSHTGGTSQHGFVDYYIGDRLPTLVQSLNGEIEGNDPIRLLFEPGTDWSYSGGGYVIAQIALEDHLNIPLADLAEEHLFKPLGMHRTTMKQPNETGFLSNVAKVHNEEGEIIRTGIPITPQVAPSGLWSTPADLAKFVMELQRALNNKNNTVLSHAVAQKVTGIVTTQVMGGWSMGWERRYGFGNYEWFSHGGANTGVGGHVFATMEDGKGIVILANGPNSIRIPVLEGLRSSIVSSHNWHKRLDVEFLQPDSELVDAITGTYRHEVFGEEVAIYRENGQLYISPAIGMKRTELFYLGNHIFFINQDPTNLRFELNKADGPLKVFGQRPGVKEVHLFTRTRSDS